MRGRNAPRPPDQQLAASSGVVTVLLGSALVSEVPKTDDMTWVRAVFLRSAQILAGGVSLLAVRALEHNSWSSRAFAEGCVIGFVVVALEGVRRWRNRGLYRPLEVSGADTAAVELGRYLKRGRLPASSAEQQALSIHVRREMEESARLRPLAAAIVAVAAAVMAYAVNAGGGARLAAAGAVAAECLWLALGWSVERHRLVRMQRLLSS